MSERPIWRRAWRRWLLVLLILLLWITGLPAIFSIPAERILFNPDSYKQALSKENAYQQFPLIVEQMIAQGGSLFLFGSRDRLMEILQNSHEETIVRQVFPQDWVRKQADGLIDQFWAYFNLQTSQFRLVVDFRPVKTHLTGPQSAQMAANIVQAFPPCTGNDLLNWTLQALNGNIQSLPLCRPPDAFINIADLVVQELLKGTGSTMPDELDLAAVLRLPAALIGQPATSTWTAGFRLYSFYRQVNPWLPFVALALLAGVGLLAREAVQGPLYWLGVGLALPGFLALVAVVLLGIQVGVIIPLVIERLFGSGLLVFDLLKGMLASVAARFMLASGITAVVVTLAGAALVAVSVWGRRETIGEAGTRINTDLRG